MVIGNSFLYVMAKPIVKSEKPLSIICTLDNKFFVILFLFKNELFYAW